MNGQEAAGVLQYREVGNHEWIECPASFFMLAKQNDKYETRTLYTSPQHSNALEMAAKVCEGLIAKSLDWDVRVQNDAFKIAADEIRKLITHPEISAPIDNVVMVDRGALQMVIQALRRDAAQGQVIRGEMADALIPDTQADHD
jgi:hypothetical protein